MDKLYPSEVVKISKCECLSALKKVYDLYKIENLMSFDNILKENKTRHYN